MKVLTFIVIAMFATVGFAADKAAEKKDDMKTEKKADAKK